MCILLIFIAAMTAFRANRWRIKAAVDERLMKGFSGEALSKSLFLSRLSPRVGRGVRGQGDHPHGLLSARWQEHYPLRRTTRLRTSLALHSSPNLSASPPAYRTRQICLAGNHSESPPALLASPFLTDARHCVTGSGRGVKILGLTGQSGESRRQKALFYRILHGLFTTSGGSRGVILFQVRFV